MLSPIGCCVGVENEFGNISKCIINWSVQWGLKCATEIHGDIF